MVNLAPREYGIRRDMRGPAPREGSQRSGGMDRRRNGLPGAVYTDKQLVIVGTDRPSGLKFIGSVDAFNVEHVENVLAGALNGESDIEVHIDLTRLEFCDVSGIRALVAAAQKSDGRHRMILHGLPPLMSRVMGVVGWSDLPSLFIAETDFPDGVQSAEGGPAPEVA
jgi:anti-anti-sigma factor